MAPLSSIWLSRKTFSPSFRRAIERLENLSFGNSSKKLNRLSKWESILKENNVLWDKLANLNGFPRNVQDSQKIATIAAMIKEFYARLSDSKHNDPSGDSNCVIDGKVVDLTISNVIVKIISWYLVRSMTPSIEILK